MKILFVMDTDTYTGNFYREMGAYITGVPDDCGVGEKEAEVAEQELSDNIYEEFCDLVNPPYMLWATPGFYNNGVGFIYKDGQEDQAKKHHAEFWANNPAYNLEPKNYLGRYEAHQSVAIELFRLPDKNIIDMLADRAKKYAGLNKINLTGIRILKEEVVHSVVEELKI